MEFQYFKGEDVLASDIILNLFANTYALKAHIIIILNCEQAFEDLKQTFRRKDWRNSLQYYSMTVLRVDDEISTILDEYSDGDLGLKNGLSKEVARAPCLPQLRSDPSGLDSHAQAGKCNFVPPHLPPNPSVA